MNVSKIPDGAVVRFYNSAYHYLKVCHVNDGVSGLVNLDTGGFVQTSELMRFWGLNPDDAEILANDIWAVMD